MPDILSIDQVAELLHCEPATAAEQFAKGVLPGLKFGRQWIAPRQAFFERLNALALEQAAERREALQRDRATAVAKGKALLTQNTLVSTPGRRRRPIPVLPPLPTSVHNPLNP